MVLTRTAAFLTLVIGLGACNRTPVSNLEKSFTMKVEAGTGEEPPVKIDFLWVVDNSSSMCQEQISLSNNFASFTDSLERYFDVDARIAVTSVDAQCDNNGIDVFAAKGKFNQHVNRSTSIACAAQVKEVCHNDTECAALDLDCRFQSCETSGEWKCLDVSEIEACIVNPNGSINTSCRRSCASNEECQALFGDPSYICLQPSPNSTGCVRPPPVDECPDDLPPFLVKNDEDDNSHLFPCIANVGISQKNCLRYEQPMRTAYMALDATFEQNRAQVESFLRPDAYLAIIIVSDEEDCSVAEGREHLVGETDYFTCGLLDTTDEGGPLVPVAHYVNKFKALKDDPGRVIVATIAGDSLETDPAAIEADREAYIASKGDPRTCHSQSYICQSTSGQADLGNRFRELAESFGPNGSFSNICNDEGIGPALQKIASTIITVINKICLPKPILGGLVVKRMRDGVETELTEGDGPGHYAVVEGAEDCAVGNELLPAIAFGDPPEPGDEIEIIYQGDPQFQ